jgi:5-methyltetrahydropteroyltriglutamate--homocysteine methyltransferase
MATLPLLPTTLVGSYPQPAWLVDKSKLLSNAPPRVRMREVWRVDADELETAQDDAVRLAVRDMERAGVDILTDGEVRRESYFNQFANALEGLDIDNPGEATNRRGKTSNVPRVTGPIKRAQSVFARDVAFLRSETDRPIKVTIPGPFTMTRLVQDDHYHDEDALIEAYADAVNAELHDLAAAGADIVQLDEPYLQSNADEAARNGISAINRALEGIECTTAIHLCFGYAYVVKDKPSGYAFLEELEDSAADQISIEAAQPKLDPSVLPALSSKTIIYGVLDLGDKEIETADTVAKRIRAALAHIEPERLVIAPDCGMKYLPRATAQGKLKALVDGAQMVRDAL